MAANHVSRLPPAPAASTPAARRVMLANRGETAPEVALRSAVHRRGCRFRKDARPLDGLRCEADLLFPSAKVAVFVDGCFWHMCPQHVTFPKANAEWWRTKLQRNFDRDRRNDAALAGAGWTVVRVWEHEEVGAAADQIVDIVRRERGRRSEQRGDRGTRMH